MIKPNCYECKYRHDIPGNTHSQCLHPDANTITAKAFMPLAFMIQDTVMIDNLRVRAEPHGIANGWFLYPVNFDPIWLIECTGFAPVAFAP